MNIGIIDCGGANLNSIYYSFKRLGINAIISNSVNELSEMNAYVLPGVGSADVVMDTLRKRDLINFIKRSNKPILGICIGCLLYTSPSPRDLSTSRMPSSA